MKPKISVVVPVYNVEAYLEKCIDSILNQTFRDIEVILVNDGSTDRSGYICDEYAKIDKRIKVIHKINEGVSSARNQGISIAKGDYIGFIDSDDIVANNMYETLYSLCITNDADISSCRNIRFFNESDISSMYVSIKNSITRIYEKENIIKAYYSGKLNEVAVWNKLYKKELFETIEFPKGRIYEDVSIMYKLYLSSNRLVEIEDTLYFYRFNPNSITNKGFSSNRFDIVNLYQEQYQIMSKAYPKVCEQIKYDYFHNLRRIFVDIINDKELEDKKKYIKRVSILTKKELKYIMNNNMVCINHKIIALLISYTPMLIYLLYIIKIKYLSNTLENY